ncbi:fungal-specific transcription factor domain-containing protein [Talaromyces proteolyticus]|uniref:Fungal-specific transcription factor domain-containing protein n=1 Tax=Talaromyces proteolyticus TaxID=1131652 RepID=A0AAD4PZB6_9EURO|nr:fungal-specific transcription factor domain-containing protein [Talaromyces proteolyticus]KAH8696232.1 fungal-specific transcription factor domain-containing protein [Talaromyces proteolyticus]
MMRSRETTQQTPPARQRAKRACTECNTRRVRCDVVLQGQPCSNCQASGGKCEVVPSKRGRYPRKSREHRASTGIENPASPRRAGHIVTTVPSGAASQLPTPNTGGSHNLDPDTTTDHYAPASEEGNTFFFGESNLLTYVTGAHTGDGPTSNTGGIQKQRLSYPWSADRAVHMENTAGGHVESDREKFLRQQGALTCPDPVACLPAIRAYFTWFHPCFPILDRVDIYRRLHSMNISPLLLQALLFIGTNYCDEKSMVPMGFKDRSEAKYLLYNRAKLLYEADWEQDHITTLQALFLMSFWRGSRSSARDVRYWLGVAITHAQLCGLHRSTRFTTRDSETARLRRRIWWAIYVRELQSSSSLGLPRRIRDEDCDIETLTPADLEEEHDESVAASFGRCEPEHVVYVMKMTHMARLLGRVVDIQFAPGSQYKATVEELETVKQDLEEWKGTLPDNMQRGVGEGNSSVWSSLLNLAYNHLRILIHRNGFLRNPRGQDDRDKQAATAAANQISRIAEDMLSQQTIQYGQMHLITGLFAALCIHVINIRTTDGVNKRLAENRAQICLLGLHEIQKYWRINNLVLDFFFQYLDESTARILLAADADRHDFGKSSSDRPPTVLAGCDGSTIPQNALPSIPQRTSTPLASIADPSGPPEDQYWNFVRMNCDGDENNIDNGDLGFLWDAQLYANLDFLEKCL